MRPTIRLLIAVSSIIALTASAQAATFYVATNGNDANPGTQAQPWATLQHGVSTIAPGDTILVESGTYAGCRIASSGQAGSVKTLKADTGATVIINVPGASNSHSSNLEIELFNNTVSYWVIDGFEVAGSPHHGIDIRGTDFITVQNCNVHNSVNTGIFLAFSYHPLIQNNQCSSNGEHGIYQSNSGDYPTIRGNTLHHNFGAGIHMNGDVKQKPGDGIISFAVVEKNIIYENGTGGGSAINCDGVSDGIIRNNLIYNNHASGISLFATDGAEGSSRNKVYNNTIVMAADGRWCVNIPKSKGSKPNPTGNKVKNNILYTPRVDKGSILTYSSSVSGFESDYNIVVDRFSANGGNTIIALSQWRTFGYDTHSILSTPDQLFVNPAANDYHLKAGSPAGNSGITLSEVPDDIEGVIRPRGTAYDIGCYESL
ncbi:MAG TPA: right-handed parallel beta-helix repeat-containing protein [Acidobacteriota bacterium]|jgi:parallel beta-helix repeat protein